MSAPLVTPDLPGRRLTLRRLRPADVSERYVRWLNDPEVTRYLDSGRTPATLSSLADYVRRFETSAHDVLYGIFDRASSAHIGNVTLNSIDWVHRRGDTGLLIGEKSFWGAGHATEAWYLICAYGFATLGLHKIRAGACVLNVGSLRALKRIGFRVEGILREEFHLEGAFYDVERLGLLAAELVPPPEWD